MIIAELIGPDWYVNGVKVPGIAELTTEECFTLAGSFIQMSDWNISLLKKHNVTHVRMTSGNLMCFEDFCAAVRVCDARHGS